MTVLTDLLPVSLAMADKKLEVCSLLIHVLCVYQVPTLDCLIFPPAVVDDASVVVFDGGTVDLTSKPAVSTVLSWLSWHLATLPRSYSFCGSPQQSTWLV